MTARDGGSAYSTTISQAGSIDGFNLYIGNQNEGNSNRNIYFNNFQIAHSGNYSSGTSQTESRALTGSGNLIASNNTVLSLSNTGNTFSGTTTIQGGATINATAANTLQNTSSISITSGTLIVSAAGAINDGASLTLTNAAGVQFNVNANETIGNLSGGGTTGGNITVASSVTLTANQTSAGTFSGVISGSGGLTKAGSATLTLAGTNTYTGATTINAGNLTLNGNDRLSDSSAVTLAGGTLQASGTVTDTMGALNVTSTGTIDMGPGDADFTFASLTGVTTSLAITNWDSGTDTITFTNASGATEAVLAKITVNGSPSGINSSNQTIIALAAAAPTGLNVTAGNGNLTATFNAPTSTSGRSITGYKHSTDGGATWSASSGSTSTTIVITGLNNGQSYNVQVRAVTVAGDGTATSSVAATPTSGATAPLAPTITGITLGNTQLDVAFTAGGNGGASITNYQYSTDGGTSWRNRASGTTASPLVITTLSTDGTTALVNGNSYNIQIRALNSVGNGTATSSTAAIPRTTPGAPTLGIITPGNGNLSVAFTAGTTGGNAITSYEFSSNDGSNWAAASGTTSPITISTHSNNGTALVNGSSYIVRLRAVNGAGSGAQSGNGTGTPRTTPSVTTDAASSIGTTTVTLGGNITSTGGNSATTRGVEYSTTNNFATGTGTQVSSSGTFGTGSYTHNITGLTKNTVYYFRAYATNSAGTTYGSQATFTTLNAPDGKNPTTANPTTAFLGDNKTLTVDSWQGFNGSNNRSYATIFGKFDNTNLTSGTTEGPGVNPGASADATSANTPRFAQTGTFYWAMRISYGSGVDYYFDASRADWSPLAASPPSTATLNIVVSALNPPSGLTATANGTTAIDLAWTKGTSGDAKDTIIVRQSVSAVATDPTNGVTYNANDSVGTGTVIYRGGLSAFQDTGLTPGVTYHYKIYSENWSYYSSGITANASLASNYDLNVATGNTETQSVVSGGAATLSGARALNKLGGGTLQLNSSSNSYTGVTTINNGTLSITVAAPSGSNGALGNAASAVVVGGGGNSTTFNIGAAVTNSRDLSIQSGGTRGISTSITSGTATQAGSTTSAANFNISVPSGGTLNITGNIDAGTSTIDKLDSGTAILAGTMTNTATLFDVMAGELQFASLAAMGNRTTGFLQNKFFFGGGTLGITGNITLGSDNGLYIGGATSIIRVAADQTFTVQSYIQDGNSTATLAKTGSGTLFLDKTGDNDYSHTTIAIREGTLSAWNTGLLSPNVTLGDTTTSGTYRFNKSDGASTSTSNFTVNAGGGSFNVVADALTISGILSGSGNLTKVGDGDLVLTGANTYTGNITISSGTLRINADSRLGAVPTGARANSISLGNAKFALDGAFTLSSNRGITLTSTGAVIDTYGNDDTYNGIIASSGTTDLEKRGGGTLTLGGANTYTGTTTITVGALTITHAGALGANGTGNGTTVASGIALNLSGPIAVGNELLTINGTGISDGGALRSLSGANSWAGAITLAANARINSDASTLTLGGAIGAGANTLFVGGAGNTTINGNITGTQTAGNGALFLDSTATITLGGTNSALTGLTLLRAGTLSAAVANLPAGTIQLGNGATSATLSITGASATHSGNISVTDSSTAGVIAIASGTTFTLSGTLGQTGSVNTTKIGKSGAGTLRLNSANTYAGQIQIGEGDVILANNTAHGVNTTTNARAIDLGLNVGDISQSNNVGLYLTNGVSSNASIYVAANTSSATRTIGLTGSGSATFLNDHFLDGTATLTGGSGTVTFSGNLTNTGGVTVSGGTVVLSGSANSYSGLTTVNSGAILQTSASDRIPSTGGLTLAGGTFRMVGAISDTLGTLNVTATSIIDLGNGANNVSLTFGAIGSISGGTLDIHNYTSGDTITFTSTTGLSSAVGSIRFFSDAGGTLVASSAVISGNTIVPTPTLTAVTLSTALTATFPNAGTGVSFTAAGSSLLGNITVTAQTGYEVSTALSSGYGASVSVAGGTTVYVRHAASRAAGDYNSATAAVLSSTSASEVNVTTSASGNTIAKATPSITWSTPSAITYGTALSATQLSATSPVAGSFSYSPASGAVLAAGSQTLNTTFTPTDTGNYTTATASVSLTVDTRAITITANNTSKTYGTTAPSGAGQTAFAITSGSMHGTDSIASVTLTYNGSPAGNATTAAPGTYSITPSAAVFGSGGSSNYTITYAPGTLTVGKANQTISGVAASESKTFGDAAYSLNATTSSGLTLAYTSSNTAVATVAANGTVTIVGVGSATLTVNQTGDANYNAATNVTQALTVSAKALTITANSTSKVYGATAPSGTGQTAFTSSGLVGSDSISSVTLTYNGSPAGNATTAAPGTYSITPSAAVFGSGSASNYAITYANGTLTVGKANQTITGVAASESKTFGDAAYSLNATTSSGLTLAYTSSNTAVATVAANGTVTIVGVGTTTLTVNQTGDANYNAATNVTQALTVSARAITITANNQTKSFGSSSSISGSSSDVTISSGTLVGTDAISSVTLTYNGTPAGNATTARAGTYTITPSALSLSPGSASNYAITYANGTLTINPVAPAVTTGTSGSITTTTAVITGSNVTSDGGGSISARGVVYGTSANPSLGGGNTSVADGSNTTGTFNSNLSGLTAGVTYHFRAYVTNGHSTVYGTSDSFSTPADVPAQVTLSRADNPTSTGFRVKWTDVANETGYHLEYATTANYTSSTLVSNIAANATSHELTGLTSGNLYYIRVRGVSAGGNGTWSANQTNQLQSIGANVTRYMSAPGATDSGSYTVADIFGANNEAGLATGSTATAATTIKLVGSNGTTGAAIFRNNSNQWQQGGSTTAGTLEVGRGKAFILENKSGSTDYFLLVGTSTNVTPPAVAIDNTATLALVASGRTTPTPLATFVQNLTPTASPTLSTHFKAATNAANADQIIIPAQPGQPAQIFFYHPSAKGGAGWFVNGKRVTTETIPAGAGVFIRKASGSTLQSFTPPTE